MATITGTGGADTKYGTTTADSIYGYGGNDSLYGRAGNDQIWGGDGTDSLWGDQNNDILRGDGGGDFIYAGDGDDVVYGGLGDDRLYGDAGTDTVKGEGGNDTVKGGTGISYLSGGDGNDTLYYAPSTANLSSLSEYLMGSRINGDAGTDTLHLENNTVYTSGTTTKASRMEINMDQGGNGYIQFVGNESNWNYNASDSGEFRGIEKLVLKGAGGATVSTGYYGGSLKMDITGTAASDRFSSYGTSDIFREGGGNDFYSVGGGTDVVFSGTSDSDRFYFDASEGGTATIHGFNDVGFQGGDRIEIPEWRMTNPDQQITEADGKTSFVLDSGQSYVVNTVGLVESVDYYFV
jgi:hypothetical protein